MEGDLGNGKQDADGSELGRGDFDGLTARSTPFSRGLLLMSAILPYLTGFFCYV